MTQAEPYTRKPMPWARPADEPAKPAADAQDDEKPEPPPPPPDGLSDAAKGHWERLAKTLAADYAYEDIDLIGLRILCEALQQYDEATAQLAESGNVILSAAGSAIKSPWVTIQKNAFDRIKPLLQVFGFGPQRL